MIRQLSPTEQVWYRIGERVSNNFIVIAEVHGDIDQNLLHDAILHVVQNQPVLTYDVETKGEKAYYTQGELEELPLNAYPVTNRDDRNFIIDQRLNTPIQTCPFWSFDLISIGRFQHTFLFTFNHLIMDGRSGMKIVEYVLKSLTEQNYQLPDVDHANSFEHNYSQQKDVMQTLSMYKWGLKNKFTRRTLIPTPEVDEKGRTAYVSKKIESAQLAKLKSFSRLYEGSVTSALAGAMGLAISNHYDLHKLINIAVAVDTRPWDKASNYDLVNYAVSTIDLAHKYNKKDKLSKLTKEFKKEIAVQCTPSQFAFDKFTRSLALKKYPQTSNFVEGIQKHLSSAGLLTNAGETQLNKQYGRLTLQHCYHVPTVHALDKSYLCLATSTHDNEMILNLSYPAHLISREDADAILNEILRQLNAV